MNKTKTEPIFEKKGRGFLSNTGTECFEWLVLHEKDEYEKDGKKKTHDWHEAFLSFSDGTQTVHLFNGYCTKELNDQLQAAKTVRKSIDDFISALEEVTKDDAQKALGTMVSENQEMGLYDEEN